MGGGEGWEACIWTGSHGLPAGLSRVPAWHQLSAAVAWIDKTLSTDFVAEYGGGRDQFDRGQTLARFVMVELSDGDVLISEGVA